MLAQSSPFVPITCPSGARMRPPVWPTAVGDGTDDGPTVVVHLRDEMLRPAVVRLLHERGYHVIVTHEEAELDEVLEQTDVRFVVVRDDTERLFTSIQCPLAAAVCWWHIAPLSFDADSDER